MIAAENACKASLRDYLGQLASSCCADDVELAALCVAEGEKFLSDPIYVLKKITENFNRSNGESFNKCIDSDELEKNIWIAQVRTLFPVVESMRTKYIAAYMEQIKAAMMSSKIKTPFGTAIENPYDIEIGTLIYMIGSGMISMSQSEYKKLDTLRIVRNNLAHMLPSEYSFVEQVLALKFTL